MMTIRLEGGWKLETEKEQKLLELTRLIIDLKLEKKKYNKEINDQIKENEAEIAELVKEEK
jgi:hypothetical protein